MLFNSTKYLYHSLQRKIIGFALLMAFLTTAHAQNAPLLNDTLPAVFNPLIVAAYKKPVRFMTLHFNRPTYKKYIVKTGGELMYWPSYPLTTGQIIARNEDWLRRNNPNIGEQIAGDIIKSNVNRLIYGRKMPVAVQPKF